MAVDPLLAPDTFVWMEATAGLGKARDPSQVWWLSPDVYIPAQGSLPTDTVQVGTESTVNVNAHIDPDSGLVHDFNIRIEVWVANPYLVMRPVNVAPEKRSSKQISANDFGATVGTFTGNPLSVSKTLLWTPSPGADPDDPEAAQIGRHRCLIARAYPHDAVNQPARSLNASTDGFYVPDDQHCVQHNIAIVPAAPRAPGEPERRFHAFPIFTTDPDGDGTVTVHAVLDPKPSERVLQTVLPRLREIKGFRQITAPPGLKVGLRRPDGGEDDGEVPDPVPGEAKEIAALGALPPANVTTRFPVARGRAEKLRLLADLSKAETGDAHVYHVTQTDSREQVVGGITVVFVRTPATEKAP